MSCCATKYYTAEEESNEIFSFLAMLLFRKKLTKNILSIVIIFCSKIFPWGLARHHLEKKKTNEEEAYISFIILNTDAVPEKLGPTLLHFQSKSIYLL